MNAEQFNALVRGDRVHLVIECEVMGFDLDDNDYVRVFWADTRPWAGCSAMGTVLRLTRDRLRSLPKADQAHVVADWLEEAGFTDAAGALRAGFPMKEVSV